ncbi:MAG TPA: hypothetical protein P5550_10875 [Bacteroidales bacterium]|nr:hypothetical protein [Bacteroidales bacterium]HRZ77641.1 hypothetical protein [Bacteroidales bacterium]
MKRIPRLLPWIAAVILLGVMSTSCATQSIVPVEEPAGFLWGLLHGFIILFSFIGSLFTDYSIYAFPNAGGWYDFGYLLGVMIFFGGGGRAGCKKA